MFLFIIIFVYLITTKYVDIICLNRIIEISPTQAGLFDIKLTNSTKKVRTYEIDINNNINNSKWNFIFDKEKIFLNPKESKNISLNIQPTDLVKKDDWEEFNFIVKTVGKSKIEKIKIMVILKNFNSNLYISNILHSPRYFKKGEKIITSFNLNNKGNVSSENINIVLYVNGEEKNKVGDIIIPANGFADIKIPWIAVKGKNELDIVVKKY